MPGLKSKKIREMSEAEREKKLQEMRIGIMKAKSSNVSASPKESRGKIRMFRKTIARILTINRENEMGIREKEPSA